MEGSFTGDHVLFFLSLCIWLYVLHAFNSVCYVFLLLCLCILIVMYALLLISEFCCSMYCFVKIVLFYVLFVCKCVLLPPGVDTIAAKYIISYVKKGSGYGHLSP